MNIFKQISKWILLKLFKTKESTELKQGEKTDGKYLVTAIVTTYLIGCVTRLPITSHRQVKVLVEISATDKELPLKKLNELIREKARSEIRDLYRDYLNQWLGPHTFGFNDHHWELEMKNVRIVQMHQIK